MVFLKWLKAWWKATEPISQEFYLEDMDEYLRQKQIEDKQARKVIKPQLEQFVRMAFQHLQPEPLNRLVRRVIRALVSEGDIQEKSCALRDGLIADIWHSTRIPYGFLCDARYFEDEHIDYLNKMLIANGVEEEFRYFSSDGLNLPTKLIERFVNFLEPIGWTCIGLDTGGDEFCIFIVKTGVYPDILDTATRFEISITDKPHRM